MVKIACICPPTATGETRHADGDDIELRQHLDFQGAVACRNAIFVCKSEDPDASIGEIAAVLTEQYLVQGVIGWTLVDEKGKPIGVTKARIRSLLLTHVDEAMIVGEAADDLYAEAVMRPLLAAGQEPTETETPEPTPDEDQTSMSSPPTPTIESTSAKSGSGSKPRKPSKPSSTTTIPTGVTVTTSRLPGGDSSYSQS